MISQTKLEAQLNLLRGHLDAALRSYAVAMELVSTAQPPRPNPPGMFKGTNSLMLAMLQHQKTMAEVAHLTSIEEPRLRAIAAGADTESHERLKLTRLLPNWRA